MKKIQLSLLIGTTAILIISLILLLVFFKYCTFNLIRDALFSLFAGCIFAFPTIIVDIVLQIKQTIENRIKIVSELEFTLQEIVLLCENASCEFDISESKFFIELKEKIVELKKNQLDLGKIYNNTITITSNDINSLIRYLSNVILKCNNIILNQSISAKEVNYITDHQDKCYKIINKIKRT